MNETRGWMMQQITTLIFGGTIQSEPYMYVCTKEVNIIAPWVTAATTTWRWIYPGSKDSIRTRNEPTRRLEMRSCATNTEYNAFC